MNQRQLDTIEDAEIIGPGSLLSEARKNQNLSVDYVASKLNIRITVIKNIEADVYDKTLPDTYNRGYLKNYAKLLGIPTQTIVEGYEKLNVFNENTAKMQSFSRKTFIKTENNILMWITYFILAIFIGLTMMWWLQDDSLNRSSSANKKIETLTEIPTETMQVNSAPLDSSPKSANTLIEGVSPENSPSNDEINTKIELVQPNEDTSSAIEQVVTETVFTFSGDCWVNIYDATGERIAWGIKKSGYIMTIGGKAPLSVTVGKPELVKIKFNGVEVDMSSFRQGHISKFTLPLTPDSTKKR